MLIGVPKEIKVREYRVGLVPANVRELVLHGHAVIVERGAGEGIGVADAQYEAAGAKIVPVRRRRLGECRDGREGEGAAGGRAQALAAGPGALHLSASRARPRADARPRRERLDLHCL